MRRTEEANIQLKEGAGFYVQVQALQPHDKKFSIFAVDLYKQANEWRLAAEVYWNIEDYVLSGECYMIAKVYDAAAKAFERAGIFYYYFD